MKTIMIILGEMLLSVFLSAQTIQQIQGNTSISNFVNQSVTTSGIVTAIFTKTNQIGGFYLQNTQKIGSASSGIFVSTANNNVYEVLIGDSVVVTGTVNENNNRTEIDIKSLSIIDHNHSLPLLNVIFPQDFINGWENYEGMRLCFHHTLSISSNYNLAKYGQLTLSSKRLFYPTNQFRPLTADCLALKNNNAIDQMTIASGSTSINPRPIPFIDSISGVRRIGEKIDNMIGVVDQIGSNYYVYPTQSIQFYGNSRTLAPSSVGDCNLKVCSYNMDYYLTSNWGQGYGAANQDEFNKQHAKLLKALLAMDVDIYCLAELQQGQGAISYMTNAMNIATNTQNYSYINDGTPINGTYIKVGFIYRNDKTTPYGPLQTINMSPYNRMISQAFTLKSNNERFILSMNHFKAKTGCPTSGADADQGDLQGCYNASRIAEAETLIQKIPTYENVSLFNDSDILILGDLNSYNQEDPVFNLIKTGYIDQIERFMPDSSYSYVFNSQAGDLDHAFASPSMNAQITGTTIWHIDADEPSYVAFNGSGYQENEYRASDHDPIIVGLRLGIVDGIENVKDKWLPIYYNANEKVLIVRKITTGTLTIYTSLGKKVLEQKIYNSNPRLPILLPKGVYIAKIEGEISQTIKFIV